MATIKKRSNEGNVLPSKKPRVENDPELHESGTMVESEELDLDEPESNEMDIRLGVSPEDLDDRPKILSKNTTNRKILSTRFKHCNEYVGAIMINLIRLILFQELFSAVGLSVTQFFLLIKDSIGLLLHYINFANLLWILTLISEWCIWIINLIFSGVMTFVSVMQGYMPAWMSVILATFWGMYQNDKATNTAFTHVEENIKGIAQKNVKYVDVLKLVESANVVVKDANDFETKAIKHKQDVDATIASMTKGIVRKGAEPTWLEWWKKPLALLYEYGILYMIRMGYKLITGLNDIIIKFVDNICHYTIIITDYTNDYVHNRSPKQPPESDMDDRKVKEIKKVIGFNTENINFIPPDVIVSAILSETLFKATGADNVSCPNVEDIKKGIQPEETAMSFLSSPDPEQVEDAINVAAENVIKNEIPSVPSIRVSSLPRDVAVSDVADQAITTIHSTWGSWIKTHCRTVVKSLARRFNIGTGGRRATRRKPKKLSGRKRRQVGRGRRTKHKNRRTRRM